MIKLFTIYMSKNKLLKHLQNDIYCRLDVSKIAGIGVFAIKTIPKGVNPFKILAKDKDKIIEDLYEYSVKNPKDKNMYTAKDRGRHFGNAFHYAWSNQLHERFLNEKDN